jgi:hypothetical protein
VATGKSKFAHIVSAVEQDIADFYGFAPQHRAIDHLIPEDLIAPLTQPTADASPDRAAVYFAESEESFEIGIHFDTEIREKLTTEDPAYSLSNANLDAFCVLVEELSHFHMLINRLDSRRQVSLLQLELQAEIDKLLFSGLYLERLCGHPHVAALFHLIFGTASRDSKRRSHYDHAENLAAKFWRDVFRRWGTDGKSLRSHEFRKLMKKNYFATLQP